MLATGRLPRGLLVLLGAVSTLGPLSMDLYLPGLTQLADGLDASASASQLTIAANLVGLAVGQLVAGPVTDALGRRRPLLAGIALFAAASLLCALAPGIELLLVLRLAQGIAGAIGIVIAMAMVRDVVEGSEAARTYAMLVMISGLAPLIAPVVGGQLLHVTDWRGTFVVLAGIAVLLGVAAWTWLPETLAPERRQVGGAAGSRRAIGRLLRDRSFVAIAICIGLAFAMLMVYLGGSVFLLEELHGVSPQAFGLIFTVNAGLMILASQLSARLVRRAGPTRLLGAGLALGTLGALGVLVAVLADLGLGLVLGSLAIVLASRGLVYPNAQALAVADHPDAAGTASGLTGVARFGFGAVFAPLAGIGGADDALPMALLMVGTSLGAGVALVVSAGAAPRRRRRRPPG